MTQERVLLKQDPELAKKRNREYARRYYERNRDKVLERRAIWNMNNKEYKKHWVINKKTLDNVTTIGYTMCARDNK